LCIEKRKQINLDRITGTCHAEEYKLLQVVRYNGVMAAHTRWMRTDWGIYSIVDNVINNIDVWRPSVLFLQTSNCP